jgi:hypothetical protein
LADALEEAGAGLLKGDGKRRQMIGGSARRSRAAATAPTVGPTTGTQA